MHLYMYKYMYKYSIVHVYMYALFLINLYGTPLAHGASFLALHSYLFGPDGAVNYDYIITNSINSLLIDSRCIPNGTHTNHC